jgi:hypothetical protein
MRVVLDYVNLCFWWTLSKLCTGLVRTIQFLTPRSFVKAKVIKYLQWKGIKVTCNKDDIGKYDKSKYTVELVINDDRFFKRCFDSSLGIGESYMVRSIIFRMFERSETIATLLASLTHNDYLLYL